MSCGGSSLQSLWHKFTSNWHGKNRVKESTECQFGTGIVEKKLFKLDNSNCEAMVTRVAG